MQETTGYLFPFDVRASLNAWEQCKDVPDVATRQERLTNLLCYNGLPLKAEIVGDETEAYVRVANISDAAVSISASPCDIEQRYAGGLAGGSGALLGSKGEGSVTLQPGNSARFRIKFTDGFLFADPATRSITVSYYTDGRPLDRQTWAGSLNVVFGPEWREPDRNFEDVAKQWPNGNLKETGKLLNGKKYGSWTYYNEEGDRIRIENYSGGSTAICDPKHPDNKGLGKRRE